jgi:hypothetical protein
MHASCVRAGKKGLVGPRSSVAAPPHGHAPLRSLAEGRTIVNIGYTLAARHRGAEEDFL